MSAGKSGPALFELIGGGTEAKPRAASVAAPVRVESAPEAPGRESALPSDPSQGRAMDPTGKSWAATRKSSSAFDTGRAVVVPLGGLYVGAAALLAVVIVVWSVAFKMGEARKDAEWKRLEDNRRGLIEEPLTQPGASSSSRNAGATPESSATGTDAGSQPAVPAAAINDPRQPGWNYLHVATLDRAEAERLVGFLAGNSVQAMAAPVDRTGLGANNPAKFDVFTLDGVPGGTQFSASAAKRREHEASVARLGKVWQREHQGGTDLSKTQWTKYQP